MKTRINIQKTAQVMIVTALLISSVLATRIVFKNLKHQYSMLPAGSGEAFFYEIIR